MHRECSESIYCGRAIESTSSVLIGSFAVEKFRPESFVIFKLWSKNVLCFFDYKLWAVQATSR